MRIFLLILLFLLACRQALPPGPEPDSNDPSFCQSAEAKLRELDCHDDRGQAVYVNKHGEKYAVTCARNIENHVPMNPKCVAKITDCKGVDQCLNQL